MPFGGVRGSAPAKTTMAPANSLLLTRFKRIVKVEWGRGHIHHLQAISWMLALYPTKIKWIPKNNALWRGPWQRPGYNNYFVVL